jgi:hypothetical protein
MPEIAQIVRKRKGKCKKEMQKEDLRSKNQKPTRQRKDRYGL